MYTVCVCRWLNSYVSLRQKRCPKGLLLHLNISFMHGGFSFACIREVWRVRAPRLADCDQSHLCNQWLRISRAAPTKTAEIFYLSSLSQNISLRQQGFSFGRVSNTRLSSHARQPTLDMISYIGAHACARSHLWKQWETKAATSKRQKVTAVESVIGLRVIAMKELRHRKIIKVPDADLGKL